MRPTPKSVKARQPNKSFDGGWREDTLCREQMITTFPRKAIMERGRPVAKINVFSEVLTTEVHKKYWSVVVQFSSSVKFAIISSTLFLIRYSCYGGIFCIWFAAVSFYRLKINTIYLSSEIKEAIFWSTESYHINCLHDTMGTYSPPDMELFSLPSVASCCGSNSCFM